MQYTAEDTMHWHSVCHECFAELLHQLLNSVLVAGCACES